MRLRVACLISLAAAAPTLPAQGSQRVDPDGHRLSLTVDSLAIYLIRGLDTTRTGMVRDELAVARDGDREVIRRLYQTTDRILGMRADTITDVLADLRPVRHRSHTERGLAVIDFTADRAQGWVRLANGDSVIVDASLAGAYNASSFDLVLRASSLKPGWQVSVDAFVPTSRATIPLTARVVAEETIAGERCWRVQADFGGTPVTFWIGQTSRRLRQQLMVLRPNMQILFSTAGPPGIRGRVT